MLPLLLAAAFTGNNACRPCHADLVKGYEATPMARSTGPIAGQVPMGSFRHGASGNEYRIASDGKVIIRPPKGPATTQQFDYAIGSGAAGISFLQLRNRFLYQAPIAWYSQKKQWAPSPGYEADHEMNWDRKVDPSCLLCHASQLTHIYGTINRYATPPFQQAGVSCERCHGPGSEHVAGKARMVLPPKLDAERRDDTCRQCHLMGEARVPRPGKAFGEYRAGDRLGDFVAYFVFDDPAGAKLRTTSHVEKLAASKCKLASGDKMWCGTCHDVHTTPKQPVAWYREKCFTCHSPDPCRRGPDCTSCHMPKSEAWDAGHAAFTDHSIPRHRNSAQFDAPLPWKLRPFSPADAGVRELGLAYAEVYRHTNDKRQRAEAVKLLQLEDKE